MDYKDEGLNNGTDLSGEINFEQLNRAAENVKFYNRVIRLSIIIIILAGAGCGIYLYSFISSGVDERIPPAASSEGKPSSKAVMENNKILNNPAGKTAEIAPATPAPAAFVDLTSDMPSGGGNGKNGRVESSGSKAAPPAAVTEDTAAAALNVEAAPPAAVSEDTAAIALNVEAAPSRPPSLEVSIQPAAPKYDVDITAIKKHLNAGRYDEFEKEASAALKNKDISQDASSILNVLMAKHAYYVAENRALAQKHIAGVKNIAGQAAGDYASIYLNLFGVSFRARARRLLDYINDNPSVNLTDTQKIEISKALAAAKMYDEALRMLNRVIASADFEEDIEYIKALTLKYHNCPDYHAAAKAVENFDYSIDSMINPDSPLPVKLSRTAIFKYNNAGPVSCLLSENKNTRTLYSYGPDTAVYEIDLLSAGNYKQYRILPQSQNFKLAGVFGIYNKRHAALLKRNGMYSLAPINNGAAAAEYLPGSFKGKEFGHIFIISPDGKYMARFIREPEKENSSSLEIINIGDQTVLFKAPGVFCRENDIEFAAFSSELIKYSIDSVLECRYFYYLKHAQAGGDNCEAGIRLKLFAYDIDKKEEKALFPVNINKAGGLNISYLDSSGCFVLSYTGKDFSAASLKFKSGTWLIKNDFGGALYISPDQGRCFSYAAGDKSRRFYFFDQARRTLVLYDIAPCGISDYLAHADSVFDYYPQYSTAKIDELKNSAIIKKLTASEIKKIDAVSARQKKELNKLKTSELLAFVNTCMRSGMTALSLEKIKAYMQKSEPLTDEDSYKILELKKEAQKVLEDDKQR